VMKNELRAYFGLKSIRGWEQYGGIERPTADKIAYILTDLWTRDAQWNQQRGARTRVIDESAASQTGGSLVDDALGSSKSADEEDVVIELKEGEVTT